MSLLYTNLPAGATIKPTPFEIAIPESEVKDLKTLLRLSKLPPTTYEGAQTDRRFGVTTEWMNESKRVWENEFDWRKQEMELNSFPHYITPITSSHGTTFNIHFVALFSENPNAQNLVFLHGWPGSFLEFLPILTLLKSKYTPKTLPYNVLIPSLPGYTFSSSPPLDREFRFEEMTDILDSLLIGLGMKGYVAQGGDIGSRVARLLGKKESCLGVHLNFCMMVRPSIFPPSTDSDLTKVEKEGIRKLEEFMENEGAYAFEHRSKPSTIGHVVGSNPLALLGWIGEKFLAWSDEDISLDIILTELSLYWFTNCFSTTIYPYRQEKGEEEGHGSSAWKLDFKHPLGISFFPKEIMNPPKKWVEMTAEKILMFKYHEKGGHFAALEVPELLLADVEEFMRLI